MKKNLTFNFKIMIESDGTVSISYKKLCEVVDELKKVLGPTHKTVIRLEKMKSEVENCGFLSCAIWVLITGKQTQRHVTLGKIAEIVYHAFPGMDVEFPYELENARVYLLPLIKSQFPDFEKYENEEDLEEAVGMTVNLPVIKNMIGVNWRN